MKRRHKKETRLPVGNRSRAVKTGQLFYLSMVLRLEDGSLMNAELDCRNAGKCFLRFSPGAFYRKGNKVDGDCDEIAGVFFKKYLQEVLYMEKKRNL